MEELPSFDELDGLSIMSLRETWRSLQASESEKVRSWQAHLSHNIDAIGERSQQQQDLWGSLSETLVEPELLDPLHRFCLAYNEARRLALEIVFPVELIRVFSDLRAAPDVLDAARISASLESLESLSARFVQSPVLPANGLPIEECLLAYRAKVKEMALESWHTQVHFDPEDRLVVETSELSQCCELLKLVRADSSVLKEFAIAFADGILRPVFLHSKFVSTTANNLQLTASGSHGLEAALQCLEFLTNRLRIVIGRLSPYIGEYLEQAMREYAHSKVHNDSVSYEELQVCILDITNFQEKVVSLGICSKDFLKDTKEEMVRDWFEHRRSRVLDQCRQAMSAWRGEMITARADDNNTTAEQFGREAPENRDIYASSLDEVTDIPLSSASATQYSISTIPKSLLDLITRCHSQIANSKHLSPTTIAGDYSREYNMEEAILKCYKSLTNSIGKSIGYPRMTVYNDCIFLANHVQEPAMIRAFGETYYAAEVQEMRDQIHSIFSRTSGLISCTSPLQNKTCLEAIQEVIDLISRRRERYEGQLTETTMFTALGTLVETAVTDMIAAVMEMTDISATESAELARMGDLLTSVENVFVTEGEAVPLAAMWCPSWFRFRLLLDILEAKLDYISELWQNGSLTADFTSYEVENLILALFSDSRKRQQTLALIRVQNPPGRP